MTDRYRSFVCEKCGQEFSNQSEYRDHKVDHMLGQAGQRETAEHIGDPGTPPTATEQPTGDAPPKASAQAAPWQNRLEDRKNQGLELAYHYRGYCFDCGNEVETITLDDVGGRWKCLVLAYCPECKEQKHKEVVHKLPEDRRVMPEKEEVEEKSEKKEKKSGKKKQVKSKSKKKDSKDKSGK